MSLVSGIRRVLPVCFTALLASGAAFGFPLWTPPAPSLDNVVEFYNSETGHYFLTSDEIEIKSLEEGKAGPGWLRTGYSFRVDNKLGTPQCATCPTIPVHRFYAPGPISHVYTANPAEVAILSQPGTGWIYEKIAFFARPPTSGMCDGVPVQRFYNGRAAQNDSNHRYVANPKARALAVSRHWIPEEIAFCAYSEVEALFTGGVSLGRQMAPSECGIFESTCLASVNLEILAPFSYQYGGGDLYRESLTGSDSREAVGIDVNAPQYLPARSFVQYPAIEYNPELTMYGLYMTTLDRGPGRITSLSPMGKASLHKYPGDARVFPFVPADTERELRLKMRLRVKTVETFDTASAAYGMPVLDFRDGKSGQHILFAIQAFGTVPPGDGIGVESSTGKIIVATVFRPDALYGESLGQSFVSTPSPFVSTVQKGTGGVFEFSLTETGFRQVVEAARSVDARLSTTLADYQLLRMELRTEIAGDGRIGLNYFPVTLELLNR